MTKLRGILLDYDDTMAPTEAVALASACSLLNSTLVQKGVQRSYHVDEFVSQFVGTTFRHILEVAGSENRVSFSTDEIEHLVAEEKLRAIQLFRESLKATEGSLEMLSHFRFAGYDLAVVSSSALARLHVCLEATGQAPYFQKSKVFSAQDSLPEPTSKPNPAIYNFAISQLGGVASDWMAVEDSINGIRSAVRAEIPACGFVGLVEPSKKAARAIELLNDGALLACENLTDLIQIVASIEAGNLTEAQYRFGRSRWEHEISRPIEIAKFTPSDESALRATSNSTKIIAFGSILWSSTDGNDQPVLAGAAVNVAEQLRALGCTNVHLVSQIGADESGRRCLAEIDRLELDTRYVKVHDSLPTGTAHRSIDDEGLLHYRIGDRSAFDAITVTDELMSLFQSATHLHFGTLALRFPESRSALSALIEMMPEKSVKFLDINLRTGCYSRETIELALSFANMVKMNEYEIRLVARMFELVKGSDENISHIIRPLCERFHLDVCLTTLGAHGVFGYLQSQSKQVFQPGIEIPVQNKLALVGAGDGFSAGFLKALTMGRDFEECCRAGNMNASHFLLERSSNRSESNVIAEAERLRVERARLILDLSKGAGPWNEVHVEPSKGRGPGTDRGR